MATRKKKSYRDEPEGWPNLTSENHKQTSDQTISYNCIAWAAGDDRRWWEPTGNPYTYWPPEAEKTNVVESYFAAFAPLGYGPTDSATLEIGIEKVAIFVDANGAPTHMARQEASGAWTSKLGNYEDIQHTDLAALEDGGYGRAKFFLARTRRLG